MGGNLPEISEYKTNFHKYDDCISIVATREVCRVFRWLYQGGDVYVGDYLKTIPGSMKHIMKRGKKSLEERSPVEEMDMSLLFQLLRYTSGLTDPKSDIWEKTSDSEKDSLEQSLYLLKEMRNEAGHEDFQLRKLPDSEMTEKMELVRKLCINILNKAGEWSHKLSEAAEAINKMEKDLRKLMGVTPELLATLAKKEIQNNRNEDIGWYSSPILLHRQATLPISDILTQDQSKSPIIIVTGDAGSGKTSLCQYLDWLWRNKWNNVVHLNEYKLVLVIKCRDVCTRDLICLLRDDLLPDTMRWCNPYEINTHLKSLKVLWIMDGLEEATAEATALIHKLMEKQYANHTILITSRPEHSYSLTTRMQAHEYMEISLRGIKPLEVLQKLKSFTHNSSYSKSDLNSFVKYFEDLQDDVKYELQIPLKLHSAMQGWKFNFKKFQKGSSLQQIYETIKEGLIDLLAHKIAVGRLSMKDANGKVKEWLFYLCKIAFEMVATKSFAEIDQNRLKKLEKKCFDLFIESPDMCLSTFLTHCGPGKYNFLHSTQQYFYASIYGASIIQRCQNLSQMLQEFGVSLSNSKKKLNSEEITLDHFYGMLLHTLSRVQESVSKSKANDLISLLSYAIQGQNGSIKWFEVMDTVCQKKKFVVPISEKIPNLWFISDQHISASIHLLKFKKPVQVHINISGNPKELVGLTELLETLASSQSAIYVELHLIYHLRISSKTEKSDEFLKLLCKENSSCCILGFAGLLSKDGYKLLQHSNMQDYCQVLKLKLKSSDCLSSLCYQVQSFQVIKYINIAFDFLTYRSIIKSVLPSCIIDLNIMQILDNHVESAVKIISSLSKSYNNIIVVKMSPRGASKFVSLLTRKEVHVNALVRLTVDQSQGRLYLTDFGSIPSKFSDDQLKALWVKSEKIPNLQGAQSN